MPIINLTLQGKQAIGDGTKIVCMNGDYLVRFTFNDCEEFVKLPVKRLVVKYGRESKEAAIESVTENGKTFFQAELPVIECQKSVEIGVYGKESNEMLIEPKFTSTSAKFECEKSALCGVVIVHKDPKLDTLYITRNGRYTAADDGVDGYYYVDVHIEEAATEQRTAALSMQYGNQVVYPSAEDRAMSQVTITKPVTMVPENIKKGVNIGGVIGTYTKTVMETEIFQDGEYTPPAGVDGFSRVIVNVGSGNYAKVMRIGDTFTYDYEASVNITIDTPGIVKYENDGDVIIFTAIGKGSCSIVLKDMDHMGGAVRTLHYAIIVDVDSDYLLPVCANSVSEMQAYLNEGVAGAVIKYTGVPASGFMTDALYIIEEEEETQ